MKVLDSPEAFIVEVDVKRARGSNLFAVVILVGMLGVVVVALGREHLWFGLGIVPIGLLIIAIAAKGSEDELVDHQSHGPELVHNRALRRVSLTRTKIQTEDVFQIEHVTVYDASMDPESTPYEIILMVVRRSDGTFGHHRIGRVSRGEHHVARVIARELGVPVTTCTIREVRKGEKIDDATCFNCGYLFTGLKTAICPKCQYLDPMKPLPIER